MSDADITDLVAANDDMCLVILRGVRVEGLLQTPYDVEISGTVDGEVRAREVIIRAKGTALGLCVARKITVDGTVREGTLIAEHVVLARGSDVEGELHYSRLDIDEGALFEGKTRRHADPMSVAPPIDVDTE